MKYVFLASFILLIIASYVTVRTRPEATSDRPIIYWVTDPNPARTQQVKLFQEWMARTHPDEPVELHVDSANSDPTKRIVQAVSGVGDDVMDTYGGGEIRYFRAMGVIRDIQDDAARLGFGLDKTYPAIGPDLCPPGADGTARQYAFPCNVTSLMFFVNREAIRRWGAPMPPMRWTFDEFEALGKQFVNAANPDPRRRMVFFADQMPVDIMRRSRGFSMFNETGTRCVLDRPENIEILNLLHKWTYEDHLLPTTGERSAVATESGYGGSGPQLFNAGNYALMYTGRYMLIQFRDFDASRKSRGQPLMDLGVAEPPHGGFPNTKIDTRAATVYAGGKNQKLALYFLQFLASREYNMQVVNDGDSLPPNPLYTQGEEYLHPADHPNEWDVHGPFAESAHSLALATSYSPFVLQSVADREDSDAIDAFMNDRLTAPQACQRVSSRIAKEMKRSIDENPALRPRYDELCKLQEQIDAYRAAGKKVPLAWLQDPFYRKYYLTMGWAE